MAVDQRVTQLLEELSVGGSSAYDQVFSLIYGQMRELAGKQLNRERPGHTITPTVLVHEAYLKLVDQSQASFRSRAHFMSVAALAMRRILINHAVKRSAAKRGGGERLVTFDDGAIDRGSASVLELLALDQLVTEFSKKHERASKVVVMRIYGGLKDDEIAEAIGVSTPTVRRDWRFAKAWLTKELRASE